MNIVAKASREGRTILSEHESKEVLRAHGLPVTREKEVRNERAFRRALADIGFPLAVKGCGPAIAHKTERGLVRLNLRTEEEAIAAFEETWDKVKDENGSVLVQEMIDGERELVMGFLRDRQFGPCVMLGLGGIFAEAFKDVAFRLAPLEKADVLDMVSEIRAGNMLSAYRAMPAADLSRLARMLIRLGDIGVNNPRIKEIDLNPVILSGSRPVVVDALIVLNS